MSNPAYDPAQAKQERPAEWTPGEVVGFCPECRDEFYVPHGGKCPADHYGEPPDLIEYVPIQQRDEARRDAYEASHYAERLGKVLMSETNELQRQRDRAQTAERKHAEAEQENERLRQALRSIANGCAAGHEGERVRRYIWIIGWPGARRGWEVWLGPIGLILTWPPQFPFEWNWGWWRARPDAKEGG